MEIIDANNDVYKIKINNYIENAFIEFNPLKKELNFISDNDLTSYLKTNEYQVRKMLHNKRRNTYYVGFKVKFVLSHGKDVAAFNDRSKIVVLDKRNNDFKSYAIDEETLKKEFIKFIQMQVTMKRKNMEALHLY
jgi:hypothetical protein